MLEFLVKIKYRRLYISIILLVLATTLFYLYAGMMFRTTKAPKLFMKDTIFNLGLLTQRDHKQTVTFEIENKGNSDLIIEKTFVTCDCIETYLEHTLLKPGRKTKLIVKVPTPFTIGEWSDSVLLYSNDPKNRICKLIIKGFVQPMVGVIPDKLEISDLLSRDKKKYEVIVTGPVGDSAFEILDAKTSDPQIIVNKIEKAGISEPRSQNSWKICLLIQGRGIDSWKGKVTIQTSNKQWPEVELPVTVHELRLFKVIPSLITFKPNQTDAEQSKDVIIYPIKSNISSLEIKDVYSPKWLRVYPLEQQKEVPNRLRLRITLLPDKPKDANNGSDKVKIVFKGDDFVSFPVLWGRD